jgi:peptidase E
MITTYILHGGFPGLKSVSNDNYYAKIVKGVPDGGTILAVFFAKPIEKRAELFSEVRASLLESAAGKPVNIVMGTEENFLTQIGTAHAVYIRGGDVDRLLLSLRRHQEFSKLFDGKTVAGDSAGAYVIAKHFWSNSRRGVFEGLGLLPVNVICHYDGKQEAIDAMRQISSDLELVVLRDGEWREFVTET